MRIIAGKYKGRQIAFPKHIRPTQDKIRQSIFDVLAGVVKGSRVLDLFAGSGALGLEALSRGAKGAWFIEQDKRCSSIIYRNLEDLAGQGQCEGDVKVFTNDVFRAIKILEKKKEFFDIVFFDPPYYRDLAKKALKTLSQSGILRPRSFVIAEHSLRDLLGEVPAGFKKIKEIIHGDIKVSFFQMRT